MGDWNLFFATSAGSAATLVGLLFVATQLHVEVFKDPTNRWAALAQSTLTILSVIFILGLFFLIPQLDLRSHAEIVVVIVAFALWRTVGVWWPVVRLAERGRRHRLAQSFWLLLAPIVVYAYLVLGAVGLWQGNALDLINVAGAVLSLFAISMRNAWRLVVSVAQDPK